MYEVQILRLGRQVQSLQANAWHTSRVAASRGRRRTAKGTWTMRRDRWLFCTKGNVCLASRRHQANVARTSTKALDVPKSRGVPATLRPRFLSVKPSGFSGFSVIQWSTGARLEEAYSFVPNMVTWASGGIRDSSIPRHPERPEHPAISGLKLAMPNGRVVAETSNSGFSALPFRGRQGRIFFSCLFAVFFIFILPF